MAARSSSAPVTPSCSTLPGRARGARSRPTTSNRDCAAAGPCWPTDTFASVVDAGSAERLGQLVSPWLRVPRPHVLLFEATGISGRKLQEVGGVEIILVDADEHP